MAPMPWPHYIKIESRFTPTATVMPVIDLQRDARYSQHPPRLYLNTYQLTHNYLVNILVLSKKNEKTELTPYLRTHPLLPYVPNYPKMTLVLLPKLIMSNPVQIQINTYNHTTLQRYHLFDG